MGNARFGKDVFTLTFILCGLLWGFPVHFFSFGLNSRERKS